LQLRRNLLLECGVALAMIWGVISPAVCQVLTAAPNNATAGIIQGQVKSAQAAIPGVEVTATDSATGQTVSTSTDVDGSYALPVPMAGEYTVQAAMAAFAPLSKKVSVGSPAREVRADFDLVLLSRSQTAEHGGRRGFAGTRGRGFQSLDVMQQAAAGEDANGGSANDIVPSGMPIPGISPNTATESLAVTGSNSSAAMSSEEMRQRFQDSRDSQGINVQPGNGPGGSPRGFVGPGGGGPGGPGGPGGGRGFGGPGGGGPGPGGPRMLFGGRGHFDINQPHGALYYTIGDSALNASPYALQGEPAANPGYAQHKFGVFLGGPLNIPHLYHGGDKTFFFFHYQGTLGSTPYDAFSTVPTLAERGGDFSQAMVRNSSGGFSAVQLYNPFTGLPIANNQITSISPQAQALLPFIPLPNLPGDSQNFHYLTTLNNSGNDLNLRLNRSLGGVRRSFRRGGPRNNLSFGFHYHSASSGVQSDYPTTGGSTAIRDFDIPIGYTRTFGKLLNSAHFDFNRSRAQTQNLYAFNNDLASQIGITGVSTNPFDWGLPNLSFTNFGSLNDVNPQLSRNNTFTWSDNMVLTRGKHTWRWGGDFRRIQLNTEADSNARGSFIFTGLNTAQIVNGTAVQGTGFDFADFLLGLPQQTSVQYGANNYHFRGNSWDLYAQDEWRVLGNLTLSYGVRYEYVSPYTEINNRIVNLDAAPGFTAVAPVLPGQAGPYAGAFPETLVKPDRNNFAPRLGLAWKALNKTVVRAGYGINYNTTAYQDIVQQLAFQPPFSITQTNVQSGPGALTLQAGFPAVAPGTVTNNYGVDPNYRLGYVQIWNLDIQQELRPTLVLNVDYTGTKGTRLDILEAPNRDASGVRIAGVEPFDWENSVGDSTAHAGSVRLRKRLQDGISIGGTYTFSKSIDDASTIGGDATVVAQNAFDLAAERGLSSFDQRHRFTADYLFELPFGRDKRFLNGGGPLDLILGNWQWSGDWTIASGLPFTPRLLGNFADVNRGTNGTLRPNVVPGQPVTVADPGISQWFNTAAFVTPPAGQFGDARRNSIEGPGSLLFDMAFTKVFALNEGRVLEFRASASNVFNRPQYTSIDTVVNSPTYGRVIAVGQMRQIQLTANFRF
jgi:hypothetical protein